MTDEQAFVPPPLPSLPSYTPTRPQRLFFTGSGGEYFKIWIVNLLLTVVTLGIYSAWAKVRRLEYFYRHTRLAGASFDYHGQPLAILKGRIVAALLFGAYYAAGLVSPAASGVAFIALILVLPFFMVQALRFQLVNSSYRGLRFRFVGGVRAAYGVFLGLGLASLLTLFTLLPFWIQRQKRYLHANAMYGRTQFRFDAPVAGFYRIYLVAFALAVGALVAATGLVTLVVFVMMGTGQNVDSTGASIATIVVSAAFGAVYVFGSVGILSYISARTQNLTWNHTSLGPHRFECTLRARSLAMITVTNLLGIVFTLGLYKPFADVRMTKYVASAFMLVPAGSLDEFLAGEQQQVTAVGQEAIEMFDVDLAF